MDFWKAEAYNIAKKITSNNELHCDLVGHVFILMHRFNFPESDIPAVFARFAYNQWNWQKSEFWRLYRSEGEALNDLVDSAETLSENKYSETLDAYLHSDDGDEFIKEITKMHLCGMTFREIRDLTGISLDTIHKAIKQFKNDLFDYRNSGCQINDDIQTS